VLPVIFCDIITPDGKQQPGQFRTTQLTQEARSLWRIKNEYKKDSAKNKELAQFWLEVAKEKEILIEDLKAVRIKAEVE
jgi:hypothetical protein